MPGRGGRPSWLSPGGRMDGLRMAESRCEPKMKSDGDALLSDHALG